MYDNSSLKNKLVKKLKQYPTEYEKRFNLKNFVKRGSKYVNETPCPHCSRFLNGLDCSACPLEKAFGVGEGLHGVPGCKRVMQAIWGPVTFLDAREKIILDAPKNEQLQEMYSAMCEAANKSVGV